MQSWSADRRVYIRDHIRLALFGAAATTAILYLLGNPSAWVGIPASLLAIGIRGWYVASEELAIRWDLTDLAVAGSHGRQVPLGDIAKVRRLGSAVQIITHAGDKLLMKYLADPDATRTAIARTAGVSAE
ncbi:hypothetical protein [Tropicimonas marinistellae]|uniref:hypothetical protein n=1 Tax=Tropicimonas marinistellae TaxID=1739787 RepID=UPI001F44189A|nr:hypothetical protein [Tropicimonas marinistellae]